MESFSSVLRTTEGFAAELRTATTQAHEDAEASPFAAALLTGEAGLEGWAALLGQLLAVYEALEAPAARLADDELAGPFVDRALHRAEAIRSDLAVLGVEPVAPLPATAAYAARIAAAGDGWPAGWVAHHYTRYLGDLSGGRMLANAARRHLGLGDDALRFTAFDGIGSPGAYKQQYRGRLDELGTRLDAPSREAVAAEATAAFAANRSLFEALAGSLAGSFSW